MKKKTFDAKMLASLGLVCFLFIAGMFSSCSKDSSGDARDLLATVPSDAGGVAVIDLGGILDKLDCKTSGSEITLSKELTEAYVKENPTDKDKPKPGELKKIDMGIAPTSLVMFYAERPYITGVLDDPAKFKAYVEKEQKGTFKEEQGANVLNEVAYIGNQFWVSPSGSISPDRLVQFTKLSKDQSYASNSLADELTKMDHDIAALASTDALLNNMGHQRNQLRLALTSIFDDASWLEFDGDFNKESFEMEASIYNSERKPAKFLLPFEKIDTKTVESLGNNADILFAAGVPKALVKKVLDVFASFGGGLPKDVTDAIGSIDGTIAGAMSDNGSGSKAVITTDGNASPALLEMLGNQSGMTVTRDDKFIRLQQGAASCGNLLNIPKVTDEFKGAYFGMATGGQSIAKGVKELVFTAKPDNGSLKFCLEITYDGDLLKNMTQFMK